MHIIPTVIEKVVIIEANAIFDSRGKFARIFCDRELSGVMEDRKIVQANLSYTTKVGAVRGMHYQNPPHAELKLVRCLRGKVFDVVVDLRQGSKTFLQWHAEELTPDNFRMMVIPEGCAHGFQTLEPDTELLYFHTAHYEPNCEGGVLYNDPQLNIEWPLECAELSDRDGRYEKLDSAFTGIKV